MTHIALFFSAAKKSCSSDSSCSIARAIGDSLEDGPRQS
jgi:hypothetical protein